MLGSLLLLLAPVTPAQACPNVTVSATTGAKGRVTYTASLDGGDMKAKPSFNWTVSAGSIQAGQGTISVQVAAEPGANVTATVEVGGFGQACWVMGSATEEVPAAAVICPVITVTSAPAGAGKAIVRARIAPAIESMQPWYWSVSPGKIIAGQGTASATVAASAGTAVKVTANQYGVPYKCNGLVTKAIKIK